MAKTSLSRNNILDNYFEQLASLREFCRMYDGGNISMYWRAIATNIHNLVHDRGETSSLLTQAGKKQKKFMSSVGDFSKSSRLGLISGENPLTFISQRNGEITFQPILGDLWLGRMMDFDQWWEETILIIDSQEEFTRKELISIARNQDGGGHWDERINSKYFRLKHDGSHAAYAADTSGNKIPVANIIPAITRQIAYELLFSLDPSLRLPRVRSELRFAVIEMTGMEYKRLPKAVSSRPMLINEKFSELIDDHRYGIAVWYATNGLRRNDPCPCGSGIRFKHCHGRQSALASTHHLSEVTPILGLNDSEPETC